MLPWLLLNINIESAYGRFAVDFYFVAKCVYISKTVGDTSKVTIYDKYEVAYALSIDTKIDDFGWPWTL